VAHPIEEKLIVILLGIFVMIVGTYFWYLAQKTPADKLIPRPLGVWWSHERAYFSAVLFWFLGLLLAIVGVVA